MMMQRIKFFSLCVLVFLAKGVLGQQNIQFTQYIFNSLYVNPAYAGYKEEWFGQMSLRSQWTGVEGAPRTGSISFDGVLDETGKRHGVGGQLIVDQLGPLAATSVYGSYALRLQLDSDDEQRLALGVSGGITQYSLDGEKLRAIDPNDPTIPTNKISTFRPDIRFGVFYNNLRWYAGFAVHDLLTKRSDEDFTFDTESLESLQRTTHGYFMAGALIDLDPGLLLRPSVLVKDDLKGPTSLDVNAMFIFNQKLWIGASYRTRARIFNRDYYDYSPNKLSTLNSISGLLQVYATPKFRIGYSYDHMLNKMNRVQNGTHELTLGISFGDKVNKYLIPKLF